MVIFTNSNKKCGIRSKNIEEFCITPKLMMNYSKKSRKLHQSV